MSTIAEFLLEQGAPREEQKAKLLADAQVIGLTEALQALALATGNLPIVQDLWKQIQGALGKPVTDGMIQAWTKWSDLREFTDATKHPPEEQNTYVLEEHTVKSTHKLRLEPSLNGKALPGIDLAADLELEIEVGSLLIQGGRIWELRVGQATGRGTLRVGKTEVASVKTRSLPLPGVVKFDKGIPIPA